ncbi:MAG: hypothetical protein IT222_00225, partial [Crocinitomix sp.]|nr:hypothetical protein [Crocinitomix sp.]
NGTFEWQDEPNYAGNDPNPELVSGTYIVEGDSVFLTANNTKTEYVQNNLEFICKCASDSSIAVDSVEISIGNQTYASFPNTIIRTYFDTDSIGITDTVFVCAQIGHTFYKRKPESSTSISVLIAEQEFPCNCYSENIIVVFLRQENLRYMHYKKMQIIDRKTLKVFEGENCCFFRK